MGKKVKEFEYKAEMRQLLHLIVHSLYKNPEIFLRELVSNSSDALNKIRFRKLTDSEIIDPEIDLNIKIYVNKETLEFSIEDSGVGMTKDDLINRIGTVASSGTLDFIKNSDNKTNINNEELIGKFGVGFYSAFIVTKEIIIDTLHADKNSKAYKWISKGEDKFIIEDSKIEHRGTKISFKFSDEHKEFADPDRIKSILKKYSNFVDFPIFVNDEEVNKVSAIWQTKKDDVDIEKYNEFYKYISNDWQEPLGHLHISIEGKINFKALLFIPQTAPPQIFTDISNKSLQLYSNRVFIQDDCKDLLPDYLKFVKGIVDSEDLPLNVSREVTQSSPLITKIKNVITSKLLAFIENWAENDKEKFDKFYKEFGSLFKTGLNSDFANKDKIIDLVRFETSATEKGKWKSLKEYIATMPDDQKEIYYIMGDHRDLIERNPNLEYFKNKGIEVLYLTDPVDVFTIPYMPEYDGKKLNSIEKANIDISNNDELKSDSLPTDKTEKLISYIKDILGDKVEDVIQSKRLVDSPVTLVVGSSGLDPQMEKMMQYMEKDFTHSKRILEINIAHKLIKNLSNLLENNKENELLNQSILQLFEGALLLEGHLQSPSDFISRMSEFIEKATS